MCICHGFGSWYAVLLFNLDIMSLCLMFNFPLPIFVFFPTFSVYSCVPFVNHSCVFKPYSYNLFCMAQLQYDSKMYYYVEKDL